MKPSSDCPLVSVGRALKKSLGGEHNLFPMGMNYMARTFLPEQRAKIWGARGDAEKQGRAPVVGRGEDDGGVD